MRRDTRLRGSCFLAAVASVAAAGAGVRPASAQDGVVLREHGDGAQTCTSLGDLDDDGTPDYAVGSPLRSVVEVFSGKDGALLRTLTSPAGTSRFGVSLASIADLDGDGRRDVVVGAFGSGKGGSPPGTASVLSSATGAEICTVQGGHAWDLFGASVAEVADVTGDGKADFVVGAPGMSGGNWPGYARVYSGTDGTLVDALSQSDEWGTGLGTSLGTSVAGVGDVNRDGFGDFVVGAHYAGRVSGVLPRGEVRLVSGKDGRKLRLFVGKPGESVGRSVANVGDVDLDGVPDLAVSVGSKAGGIRLVSGRKLKLIRRTKSPSPDRWFGAILGPAGDVDGDGLTDVAAAGTGGFGFVCVISSSGRGVLALHEGGDGDYLGLDTAVGVGDLTGDGVPELAVSGDRFVRIYVGASSSMAPVSRSYPLVRPDASGAGSGAVGLRVRGRTVTVTFDVKGVAAGDRLLVLLEDAPGSGTLAQVGELLVTRPDKGAGTLTLTGTDGPPAALGVATLSALSGRRVELRSEGGATLLSAVLPPLTPRPSVAWSLPLAPPPGGPLPGARGTLRASFDGPTFHGTIDLRTTGLRADAAYALFVEDAPGAGTWLDVGPLANGRYLRSTRTGAPLPAGVTTLTELAGRRIEVRDSGSGVAVLAATLQ